jgi:rubrerythrin
MSKQEKIKEIKTIIEVAILAIPKERAARTHYLSAASRAPGDLSRRIFEELAAQEKEHEEKLEALIAILEDELKEL